ncbi:Putative amidoligase enzyme [Septoria linicola]|uniref:Amidoligase enzyme n=1 Tax=Septoria linicola TaxID=215465 RepID=A0A9Q9AMD1_9PEZI|nr:Putative amidoligase enzyme [Septoria linicola]
MSDASNDRDISYRFNPEFQELDSNEQDLLIERWQKQYDDESSLQGPLNLSLGIEIEFILLQIMKDDPSQDSGPDVLRGQEKVHEALSRPMYTHCNRCSDNHEYKLKLNSLMNDTDKKDQGGPYHAWSVGHDLLSVNMDGKFDEQFKSIQEHHIEIRSRILHVDGDTKADARDSICQHRPQVTYREEIEAIYTRLHEEFLTPSSDPIKNAWRMINNQTCGLHVHIGNGGPDRRLPLPTVKNIMNLYFANEKAIDNMHSSTRITGSTLLTNPEFEPYPASPHQQMIDGTMNIPLSAHYMHMAHLNREDPQKYLEHISKNSRDENPALFPNCSFPGDAQLEADAKSMNIAAWNRVIANAETIANLRVVHGERKKYSALNIDHMRLPDSAEGAKQTIEFRQAAGTLDAETALAWVDVLVRLVNYAHGKTVEDVIEECEKIWNDERHSTLDFLATLGFGKKDSQGQKRSVFNDEHGTFEHYKYATGQFKKGRRDYDSLAQEHYQKDLQIAEAYGEEDFFYKIVKANSEMTFDETKPWAVRDKIHDKFMIGAYGQYSKGFLRQLGYEKDWDFRRTEKNELKGRLVVGWVYGETVGDKPLDDEPAVAVASATAAATTSAEEDENEDVQPRPAKRRKHHLKVADEDDSDMDMS